MPQEISLGYCKLTRRFGEQKGQFNKPQQRTTTAKIIGEGRVEVLVETGHWNLRKGKVTVKYKLL